MFQVGDRLIYSFYGICIVLGIVEKEVNGQFKKYYELKPVIDSRATIFTPIDNEKVLLRSIVSKEEAQDILDSVDNMEVAWPEKVWKRNQEFKQITRTADLRLNLNLYKILLHHELKLKEEGKKMIVQDSRILDTVETLVCSELTEALGVEQKYILSKVAGTLINCAE